MKTVITSLLLLTLSSTLHAFTLNNSAGAAFSGNEVTVNVEASTCQNIGITNDELLNIAADAVSEFWNRAPTSRLKLTRGSVVSLSSNFYTGKLCTASGTTCTPNPALVVSGYILIACNNESTQNFTSSALLGLTLPNNVSGRTINGAIVLINDRANSQFATKSRHEKMTILAHEIGHALGLGHSPIQDSLMYYAHNPNRNYLGEDDIDGIAFLYPAEQPQIGGCGTIEKINAKPWQGMLALGFFIPYFLGIFLRAKRRSEL